MANNKLAIVALDRANRGLGPRAGMCCQKWARLTVQAALGARFNKWWRDSALHTAQAFLESPPKGSVVMRTTDAGKTQLGDLLYATSGHGGFGHVGVRVEGNRVAENSVVHHGKFGAIGFRALGDFDFDVVVRLPEG